MLHIFQMIEVLRTKFQSINVELDERRRRIWAATEAVAIGRGGVAIVSKATGIAESTISIGRKELTAFNSHDQENRRTRKSGGGRKRIETTNQDLLKALDALVEPTSRGDPMSPLRWTCKSTRNLANELSVSGYSVSHTKIADLLTQLNYSLQGTRKVMEGKEHPDRNG
jgi:hypothetical protein